MTNEQMIRELRAVAEKHRGKQTYTFDTNITLMATETANRIESLCDEISRQKAEIERLKDLNNVLETDYINANMNLEHIQHEFDLLNQEKSVVVADSVKEFAERVKEKAYTNNYCHEVVLVSEIDNLAKEFKEGK